MCDDNDEGLVSTRSERSRHEKATGAVNALRESRLETGTVFRLASGTISSLTAAVRSVRR